MRIIKIAWIEKKAEKSFGDSGKCITFASAIERDML
jgi:hypothetical protein